MVASGTICTAGYLCGCRCAMRQTRRTDGRTDRQPDGELLAACRERLSSRRQTNAWIHRRSAKRLAGRPTDRPTGRPTNWTNQPNRTAIYAIDPIRLARARVKSGRGRIDRRQIFSMTVETGSKYSSAAVRGSRCTQTWYKQRAVQQ